MATVALDQYLASIINAAQVDTSEIALKSGNLNFDLFRLYLENNNPGQHRYLDPIPVILYVISGKVVIKINNQTLEMISGNLLLLTRNCKYEITNQSEDAVLVKFKFSAGFDYFTLFEKYAADGQKEEQLIADINLSFRKDQILFIKNNQINRASQTAQSIINSYLNQDLFTRSIINSEIDLLLVLSLRNQRIVALDNNSDLNKTKFNKDNLDKYIDAHFTDITLSGAAKYFDFNPNYFSNLVKQKTGKSFVEHVDERRMQEAKILLAQPDLSLKEIINRVGYSSKSFFYKKFSEYYGETPAAMRQNLFREAKINLKF